MANLTTMSLANGIPAIVAAEALGALQANTVLANIINRDFDESVASYGGSVKIAKRGALSANDKAADTVVTLQAPTDTAVTVSLSKHKEVSFLAEDIAIMQARPDYIAGYAEDAAKALAEQIDTDIAALYSGLSQTIDASSGLGEDDFREAQRLLNAAKAPVTNRWAVLHEDAYSEASAIDKLINRDYQGPEGATAVREGMLGFLSGFNVVMDQMIPVATTCKNLFLHRDALVLVTRPMRQTESAGVSQVVMSENGIGLRVTTSYDADHLGEKMTVDILYGVAEMRDDHGVVVSTTEV